MDKLVAELIELLRLLLGAHGRLLAIATARREAMRLFDVGGMNDLLERERQELAGVQGLEQQRRNLIARFGPVLGRGVAATTGEIANRCQEPRRTQVLTLAAELRSVVEKLDRESRINVKVSQGVVKSLSKVMQVITGMAQHAGLYMRNGRKTTMAGMHLLDAVG